MTHEEVAILWKDANGWDVRGYKNTLEDLVAFAKLVAAKEREAAVRVERQRIVNLLMIQHEAAKEAHNYWHVAANLIQAETGEQA